MRIFDFILSKLIFDSKKKTREIIGEDSSAACRLFCGNTQSLSQHVPCLPGFGRLATIASNYCCGGGSVGAVVFGFALCFRGVVFIGPADPNVNDRFSPGTLINVTRSPILRTRTETAGSAGGGFGLGVTGVKSPNIMVAPM